MATINNTQLTIFKEACNSLLEYTPEELKRIDEIAGQLQEIILGAKRRSSVGQPQTHDVAERRGA